MLLSAAGCVREWRGRLVPCPYRSRPAGALWHRSRLPFPQVAEPAVAPNFGLRFQQSSLHCGYLRLTKVLDSLRSLPPAHTHELRVFASISGKTEHSTSWPGLQKHQAFADRYLLALFLPIHSRMYAGQSSNLILFVSLRSKPLLRLD